MEAFIFIHFHEFDQFVTCFTHLNQTEDPRTLSKAQLHAAEEQCQVHETPVKRASNKPAKLLNLA